MSDRPNNAPGYEVDTLRGRWIGVFIGGFILFMAISFWLVERTLRRLNKSTPLPAAKSLVEIKPVNHAPRLQPTQTVDHLPIEDLEALRSREDDVFVKLGWAVDRTKHQAVISDQVIQRLADSQKPEVTR